jgi:succinoglycan biosynthesis transport protein ExoP
MKSIGALLAIARRNLLALLLWTLLGGATGSAMTFFLPVEYQASARVMIVAPYWNDSTAIADPNIGGAVLAYGDEFTQQRVASYARLVDTPFVTGPVSQRLGLRISAQDLARKLSTHVIPDTVIMEIQANDRSPTTAALIADETARQLIETVKEVERPPFTRVSPVQPLLVQTAAVPTRPVSPRTMLYVGSGLLLGFLTGLTWVSMREGRALAELVGSAGDADNVLGILSADESGTGLVDADSGFAELQINRRRGDGWAPLLFVAPRGTPAVMLATRRLAATMSAARSRRPVIVVADSSLDTGVAGQPGLLDVAAGLSALDDAIVLDDVGGFDWLPFGGASESAARPRCGALSAVLDQLATTQDVLVVAPAVLESVDAIDLTGPDSVTVLVTEVPGTSSSEVREAERLLRMGKGRYLGRVIVATPAFVHNGLADRL